MNNKAFLFLLICFIYNDAFAQNSLLVNASHSSVSLEPPADKISHVESPNKNNISDDVNYLSGAQQSSQKNISPYFKGKTSGNHQSSISIGEVLIKVFIGLAIVLSIIGLLAWLSNKAGINRLTQHKKIHLRESLNLSAKEKLVIVDFSGESLLLGVTTGKISLLKSVSQLPVAKGDEEKPVLGAKNALDFQHKLNEFLLKGGQS